MKKKTLSLALALALCLGLMAPAFAADTKSAEPVECFTLTGVVSEEMQPASPVGIMLYKMEFPATLVFSGLGQLDDSGYLRRVELFANIYGAAQNGPEKPADWNFEENGPYIPGQWVRTGQIAELERTEDGVYTFDESFAGKYVFLEMCEGWENATESSGAGGQPTASGWTEVLLQFPDAGDTQPGGSAEPEQPTTPVIEVENIPASGTALASTQTVTVDGKAVEFQMYALADANGNLTNYIKLRDMAYVLNGTKAQFSVGYDGIISLTKGQPYEAGGTEMTTPFSGDRAYTGGAQTLKIDGKDVAMTAITLTDDNGGGYNYFKLRDLGKALGFNVSWDNGVIVESDKPYAG